MDEHCPLAARHGYFESAPNHDAVGLRVADDELAQSIYTSMISIPGLRPGDFTIPNFPDCKTQASSLPPPNLFFCLYLELCHKLWPV